MNERRGGHEIVIEVRKGSGSLIGRDPKVGVKIRCPLGSDLALRASSADLDVKGALGLVDAKTASGDVALDDAAAARRRHRERRRPRSATSRARCRCARPRGTCRCGAASAS